MAKKAKKTVKRKNKKQKTKSSFVKKLYQFLGGAILLSLCLSTIISIISYNPLDSSFFFSSSEKISNILGAFGSYSADLVLKIFGISLIVFIFAPIIWGYELAFFKQKINYPSRIFAFFIGIFSLSTFLALLPKYFGPFNLGGIIGKTSGRTIRNFANFFIPEPYIIYVTATILFILFLLAFNYSLGITYKIWINWFSLASSFFKGVFFSIKNLLTFTKKKPNKTTSKKELKIKERVKIPPSLSPVESIKIEKTILKNGYIPPSINLLSKPEKTKIGDDLSQKELEKIATDLESVLQEFGVSGKIVKIRPGPVVTLYELEPAAGIKTARVIGLADDIARSMAVSSVRIAVVFGSSTIGIEMPNDNRQTVWIRELLEDKDFHNNKNILNIILGKDIGGKNVYADLAKMPHLLVAGTTGSGKSVGVNQMILSLLYKLGPDECKLIMIDPKMLEFSMYNGIPHLLTPVITDPSKAVIGLKWAVKEMEDRYRSMAKFNVRNITGYNKKLEELRAKGEVVKRKVQTGFDVDTGNAIFEEQEIDLTPLPYIVIIVDEMADLMLVAGKDVEAAIQRLAQMARAAGLHLIMSTQRPSVDVITGTIKANFPTRISFQVTSKIDSRTILGEQGAEQLLGRGDMLYMPAGQRPTRIHGSYIKDAEIEDIVKFIRSQRKAEYVDGITDGELSNNGGSAIFDSGSFGSGNEDDDLYNQALAIVTQEKRASTSYIQRRLRIGYNRAATIIDKLEANGIISGADGVGRREVLV